MRAQHPGIRRIISGKLAPDRAIATGMVEVLRGRGDLLDRFASTFHLAAWPEQRRRAATRDRGCKGGGAGVSASSAVFGWRPKNDHRSSRSSPNKIRRISTGCGRALTAVAKSRK
jgi:hypothetical protein